MIAVVCAYVVLPPVRCPGYRKQPPEFLEDETGQQVPNPAREEWVKAPNENMRTEALKMGNNMVLQPEPCALNPKP